MIRDWLLAFPLVALSSPALGQSLNLVCDLRVVACDESGRCAEGQRLGVEFNGDCSQIKVGLGYTGFNLSGLNTPTFRGFVPYYYLPDYYPMPIFLTFAPDFTSATWLQGHSGGDGGSVYAGPCELG